ncbi:MAG: putative Outer rane cobalamin receptor protein [Caulobacter sp.]|nr:putative Outer rane cobalamin receptor protein [Caulobacter sp.]
MRFLVALTAGVCLPALASSAWAQDSATPQSPPQTARSQAADGSTTTTVADIIVTGSRAIRDGRDAPTPLTVAGVDQLQLTPSNIPEALNKLPQFAGSTTNVGAGNGAGSGRSNIFTGNFINLRSFGAIRTLVLQDGRRVPSTTLNGQVDTNTIPQLLVKRVEIVTGGASAVYGSDAVTGVVNFIMDRSFTGLKGVVQSGVSDQGDGTSWKVGLAGGSEVLDRGHFVWSVEHYENEGLASMADRGWSATVPTYTGLGSAASPLVLTNNGRISNVTNGGLGRTAPFIGRQFVGTGTLAPFTAGTPTTTSTVQVGGDGAYYQGVNLVLPLETNQAFARFDYDLSESATFYVQASLAEAKAYGVHNSAETPQNYRIYSGNAFLPADAQATLTAGNTAFFGLGRLNNDLMADSTLDQKTVSQRYTTGFRGKVFGDFRWDVFYTYGQADVDSVTHNNINYPHFYAALDAVKNTQGATVCRVDITNPGLYPGCAPINMFGVGNQSQAAKDYIYEDTAWAATNKMHDFGASINGSPFSTWAGPVSVALNAEYREESLVQTTTASSLTVPSFTGIRLAAPTALAWAYPTEAPMTGKNNVWEVGGEVLVPLLEDKPFAQRLAINGALRYTHYSTSGGETTWKLGTIWQPVNDLKFRGAVSQDIRAPTLYDLFAGRSVSFTNLSDPHTGLNGTASVIKTGNPDLVPEVARTYTAGFLYTPSWLPRFALSLDYFDIRIDNAIGTINGNSTSILQECETSGGTSPVCAAIVRPLAFSDKSAANFPTAVLNANLNVAETYTRGVDLEASYNFDLANVAPSLPGAIDLRLLYTYQPDLETRTFPTSALLNLAGAAGLSKSRVASFIGYKNEGFRADLQLRYYSGQKRSEDPNLVFADPPLPSTFYADVGLSQELKFKERELELFFNVNNLFDKDPRISPSTTRVGIPGTGNPAVNGDDVVGRYYTVGLRFKM